MVTAEVTVTNPVANRERQQIKERLTLIETSHNVRKTMSREEEKVLLYFGQFVMALSRIDDSILQHIELKLAADPTTTVLSVLYRKPNEEKPNLNAYSVLFHLCVTSDPVDLTVVQSRPLTKDVIKEHGDSYPVWGEWLAVPFTNFLKDLLALPSTRVTGDLTNSEVASFNVHSSDVNVYSYVSKTVMGELFRRTF